MAEIAEKVQHSPLPWTTDSDENDQMNVFGADDQWVARLPHGCVGNIELLQRANAEFIVRAVNSHDDLIASLKHLLPIAVRMQATCDSGETMCYDNEFDACDAVEYAQAIEIANATLAKAEGRA